MAVSSTYVGIDLGGARGKTTAVARLRTAVDGGVRVEEIALRHRGVTPFSDHVLIAYLDQLGDNTVVAIDAPLTAPACVRCRQPTCPSWQECTDPAVIWLRAATAELAEAARQTSYEGVAAIPITSSHFRDTVTSKRLQPRLTPYLHRCTEIHLHYHRSVMPRDMMGKGSGPIATRAGYLRRLLQCRGFELNRNLIEVSPRVTVRALFGEKPARGYKRDADPWETRAAIIEGLSDLRFAPTSRLAREDALRNDHCFEALLGGYTAYLRSRDDWKLPEKDAELLQTDGWIWAP